VFDRVIRRADDVGLSGGQRCDSMKIA